MVRGKDELLRGITRRRVLSGRVKEGCGREAKDQREKERERGREGVRRKE